MCSSISPEKDQQTEKKTKCCGPSVPKFKVSKIIRKVTKKVKKDSSSQAMVIPLVSNNENLPPDFDLRSKKYTVNKKRSAQQHYDRLRQHVPNLEGKEDVSQLDVLLEAIQYIQALKKDLSKEDKQLQIKPTTAQPMSEDEANPQAKLPPKSTAV